MGQTGSRTLWEEGREPGREVVALGVALALTAAALDLLITGRLSPLFDVGFVLLCLALALAVHPRDFFVVGVLPPLLMLATFTLLAMSRSEALTHPHDGVVGAVTAALADHVVALLLGYLACLGVLALRRQVTERRHTSAGPGVTRTDRGLRLPV